MSNSTIVIMAKQRDPFARVAKSMLADPKLSWRTKGVLSYLLGKPDGWKLRISDLRNSSTDGERSIRAALREARAHGYAQLVAVREGNRISEWVWKISDSPIFLDVRFEHLENEQVQNAHPNKKDSSKKGGFRRGSQEAPPRSVSASDLPPVGEHPARPEEGSAGDESSRGHEPGARIGGFTPRKGQGEATVAHEQPRDARGQGSLKSAKRAQKRIAREAGEQARLAKWDEEFDPREIDKGLR